MKNRITGFILLICSIFIYFNMGIKERARIAKGISESAWPTALLFLLAILSILLIIQGYKEEKSKLDIKNMIKGLISKASARFIIAIASCLLYVPVLDVLGFLIATPLLLMTLLFLLGNRKIITIVPAPIIITVVIIILFSNLIHLPLPTGSGIFKTINQLII